MPNHRSRRRSLRRRYESDGKQLRFPPIPITTVHNSRSRQRDLFSIGKMDVSHYPDDPELDAVDGPDGRPAGAAIKYWIVTYVDVDGKLASTNFEYAIYVQGNKRITLTKERTITALSGFSAFVKQAGGCKCRKYFGVE